MNWTNVAIGAALGVTAIATTCITVAAINKNTNSLNEGNNAIRDRNDILREQTEMIKKHNELLKEYLRNRDPDPKVDDAINLNL